MYIVGGCIMGGVLKTTSKLFKLHPLQDQREVVSIVPRCALHNGVPRT